MSEDKRQGFLIAPPAEPLPTVFLEHLEGTTGEYTAERFRSQKPEEYRRVIFFLSQGHGVQWVEDWFRNAERTRAHDAGEQPKATISKNTVKAIRRAEGESIDLLKERLAKEAFSAADDYREAAGLILAEIMADKYRRRELTIGDVQRLEIASGIATQNGQLLSGQPTARVELTELRPPEHEDFNRALAALPRAQVIEVTPTHSAGETPGQKEAAPLKATETGPSAPGSEASRRLDDGDSDSQSEGKAT